MNVPRTRTVLTRAEIRGALAAAHVDVFGEEASDGRLAVASAQAWLETGNGQACWCFNFGNVDAQRGWDGDVFELTADEVIDGRRVQRTKRLCAFASAAEGAAHQWRRLRDSYAPALAAFDAGDGDRAARLLKLCRYYTGDVEQYSRTMGALVCEYHRDFGGSP